MSAFRAARRQRFTKSQSVRARLAEMAQSLGPGARLPTVVQLREQMGVSGTTLHGALGDLEAQGIVFRRHGVGIFVSDALHRREVALVCHPSFFFAPDSSPFWGLLTDRAQARAARENEHVSLHFATFTGGEVPVADGLRDDLENGRVDGVISIGLDEAAAHWLEERVPHVAFAGPGRCLVTIDNSEVVRGGAAALKARGCKRLALWSPLAPDRPYSSLPAPGADEHSVTFRAALADANLPYVPEVCENGTRFANPDACEVRLSQQAQGLETARRVFGASRETWPDGVICTDDMMTRGALTAWERMGVRVGADVQVATHANVGSHTLMGYDDALTRIAVDPARLADALFDLLETLMSGDTPKENVVRVAARRLN